MSLIKKLARWALRDEVQPPAPTPQPKAMKIRDEHVPAKEGIGHPWALPKPPPGVIPPSSMAMDWNSRAVAGMYAWGMESVFSEGLQFPGYPYLAELTQRAEYRRPAEIIAKQMTRKWIKLISNGEEDKTDKLKTIESEMKRLKVQSMFEKACETEGYFGRAQIFLDMGTTEQEEELKTPLTDDPLKVPLMGLKRLVLVEPMWTYPNQYNSNNPLLPDYFKPSSWLVMGTDVHASRLLTFVARPVPEILKPAYAFGGLSLSQMAKPYVDNWLRTRQSVSDLIHSFSTPVLKVNMQEVLNNGAADMLFRRLKMFTQTRDNRGVMALDKDTEEFETVTTPLGSLDALQAQSQEHMATVFGIPLIVLFGITPSGLNASSEGELDVFEAWIGAQQEQLFTPHITRILNLVQLSLFGAIDPDIGFEYEPLGVLDELQLATARKTEAETDSTLIDSGVITPMESRIRLAAAEDSPYAGLDLSVIPEAPAPEGGGFPGQEGEPGEEPGEEGEPGDNPFGGPPPEPPKDDRPDAPGHPGAKMIEGQGAAEKGQAGFKKDAGTAPKEKPGASKAFGKPA